MDRASSLRRAQELLIELTDDVQALRERVADEPALQQEEMRSAIAEAREVAQPERRRRWTDVLLPET
jgi:hypothetical protein